MDIFFFGRKKKMDITNEIHISKVTKIYILSDPILKKKKEEGNIKIIFIFF